jgi:hypothetical protein
VSDDVSRLLAERERVMQEAVAAVETECAGKPAVLIVPKLRAAMVGAGVEPHEEWLQEAAVRISERRPLGD